MLVSKTSIFDRKVPYIMKKTACLIFGLLICISLLAFPTALAETTTSGGTTAGTTTADSSVTTTTNHSSATTTTGKNNSGTTTAAATTTAGGTVSVVKTRLIVANMNGKIAARITDEEGRPIEGVPVSLQLGTTSMPAVVTDANGYAQYPYAFPTDDTYVYCSSEKTTLNGITYAAAAASSGKPIGTTTAVNDRTTTTNTTKVTGSTTKTTQKKTTKTTKSEPLTFFTGAGTTGIEETLITLNFCFDSGILTSFGADEKDFADTARLLLSQENYAAMVGDMNGVLMLSATTSTTEVTDEQITASLANDPVLSRIDLNKTKRLIMNLSPKLVNAATGKMTDFWNIPEGTYVIQLPIPKEMRNAQSITVSAVTADGVSEPIVAYVSKDGFLRFQTSSPAGTVLLLGFESGMLGTLTNHAVRTSLIFLLLGLSCIGGAVFLFLRFVRSPKKKTVKKKEEPTEVTPKEEPENIAAELPPVGEGNERIDFDSGLDIFAESEPHAPREKSPSDYDIPL